MSISEHTHMPEPVRRLEVFTGAGRRRNWSGAEKATIVAESYDAGATVCSVARRHGLTPQQLFAWRRLARRAEGTSLFVPAVIEAIPPRELSVTTTAPSIGQSSPRSSKPASSSTSSRTAISPTSSGEATRRSRTALCEVQILTQMLQSSKARRGTDAKASTPFSSVDVSSLHSASASSNEMTRKTVVPAFCWRTQSVGSVAH